jgi:hypothetical protein
MLQRIKAEVSLMRSLRVIMDRNDAAFFAELVSSREQGTGNRERIVHGERSSVGDAGDALK